MPRNASTGTYEEINDSWAPAVAGTPIDPDDWNTQYADFADTFGTDSLDRTGKGAMLANLDHGAFSSLYTEIATPSNPSANVLKVYAKDVTGVTKLATLDSAGTESIFSGGTVTSVSGTANRITVATGTTTPVIDISASYVGQSSITTLGTIATGVWNGTSIGAGFGGTGQSTYAVGDILYASASTTLSKLADVAAGSYLRSGGVTTAPVWSTTTLPNSATTGDILYASASNVYSNLADVAVGRVLISGGIGTAPSYSATPALGVAGATLGTISFAGNTSGVVTVQPQAAAGTYNFNLPTAAGTSGQPLLSGGGGGAAQTYSTLGIGGGGTGAVTAAAARAALGTFGQVKVGSITRDMTAATGSVATTGVGFQPRVMFFFCADETTNAMGSWGFSDGSSHRCVYRDGVAGNITPFTSGCIVGNPSSGATQIATVASFDSDGFTLSWTKGSTPTGIMDVMYVALGN